MATDPFYEVHGHGYTAAFMLGGGENLEQVENIDAEVTLADGTRWRGTFLTLAEIDRIMKRWQVTGECDGGAYFQVSDLIVVRDPGIPAMVKALDHAIAERGAESILVPLEDEDDNSSELGGDGGGYPGGACHAIDLGLR